MKKNILRYNSQKFIDTLDSVERVVVEASANTIYFEVSKNKVREEAQFKQVPWYVSNSVSLDRVETMVIY